MRDLFWVVVAVAGAPPWVQPVGIGLLGAAVAALVVVWRMR